MFATRDFWLRSLGHALVYSESPCKADVILVLAGDYTGDRVLKAAQLQKEGWAPKVMISGAGFAYGFNEGELALRFAVHAGYPADAFFNYPSPARSTAEEARYAIPEMRRLGVHRFILVTSNFHTRRAAAIYRKAAPDLPFCVVAARCQDFDPDSWWQQREGRKTAFLEWCKSLSAPFGL